MRGNPEHMTRNRFNCVIMTCGIVSLPQRGYEVPDAVGSDDTYANPHHSLRSRRGTPACRQSRVVTEPAGETVDASKAVLSLNGRGDPRGRPFSMAGGYKTRPYGENAVRYVCSNSSLPCLKGGGPSASADGGGIC